MKRAGAAGLAPIRGPAYCSPVSTPIPVMLGRDHMGVLGPEESDSELVHHIFILQILAM